MNVIFTRDGFRALRLVAIVALVGLGVAVSLVVGSYMYWQYEKSNDLKSISAEADAQRRVANARREQSDLRDSAQTYENLTARGMFVAEQRLDLIEAMNALKDRHRLMDLQYELQPQRPLKMANGGSYPAVDVLASRMKFKVRAYHDGDLVTFLNDFPRIQRGFFPLDRCVMTRRADAERAVRGATRNETAVVNALAGASSEGNIADVPVIAANSIDSTHVVTAECTLEWITLQDKRNPPRLAQAGSMSR
jgi:hypothetical protein